MHKVIATYNDSSYNTLDYTQGDNYELGYPLGHREELLSFTLINPGPIPKECYLSTKKFYTHPLLIIALNPLSPTPPLSLDSPRHTKRPTRPHYLTSKLNPCSADTASPTFKLSRVSCSSPDQDTINIDSSIIASLLTRTDIEFKVYFNPPTKHASGLRALIQVVSNPTVSLLYAKPIAQHKDMELTLTTYDKNRIRQYILQQLHLVEDDTLISMIIPILIKTITDNPSPQKLERLLTEYTINTNHYYIMILNFIYSNCPSPYEPNIEIATRFLLLKIFDQDTDQIDKKTLYQDLIFHSIEHKLISVEQVATSTPNTYLNYLLGNPDLLDKKLNELYKFSRHTQNSFICHHFEHKSFLHHRILIDLFKQIIEPYSGPEKIELLDKLIHGITTIKMLMNTAPENPPHFDTSQISLIESIFSIDILTTFFKLKTINFKPASNDPLTQLNINMISNINSEDTITWLICGLIQNVWPNLNQLFCYQEREVKQDQLELLHVTIAQHCRKHRIKTFKADLNISSYYTPPPNFRLDGAYLIYTLPSTEDI